MDSFSSFVDSLADEPVIVRTGTTEQRHPCGQCGGTGKWSGGTNRHGNSNCLACKGKGYFTTSNEFRAKQRAAKVRKAEDVKEDNRCVATERWGDLIEALKAETGWNTFAADIVTDFIFGKHLADSRMQAAASMMAKLTATREAKNAERNAVTAKKSGEVDLARIREMFDAVVSTGHKKPTYRAEGLKISLAPAGGRNAGALYVVEIDSDAYQGKVEGVQFKAVREAADTTMAALLTIASNPLDAAIRYGRMTGKCGCCGRELTNKISIDLGIGPTCREQWGL